MAWDNSKTNAQVTVAAFSVEKAAAALGESYGKKNLGVLIGGGLGLAIQPVTWLIQKSGPDAGDAFIYGASAVAAAGGSVLAAPATFVGVMKAFVDDYVASKVAEAKQDEPEAVRGGIMGADDFSFMASNNHITAMTIASFGGVAWQHPNGAYLFIRDAKKLNICDYQPRTYKRLYKPVLPAKWNGSRVVWRYEEN